MNENQAVLCNPPVAGFSQKRNLNMSQGDVTRQEDNSQEGTYQEDSAQEAAKGIRVRMTMSGRPRESGLME